MNSPAPSDDQHAAMREALRRDAARIQEPPFDVALHRSTMRRIRTFAGASPQPWIRWWKPMVAGLAVLVVIALGIGLWFPRDSQRVAPRTTPPRDFAAVLASVQTAVASLSVDTLSPTPAWMSPTASLLDPPRTFSLNIKYQP